MDTWHTAIYTDTEFFAAPLMSTEPVALHCIVWEPLLETQGKTSKHLVEVLRECAVIHFLQLRNTK